MSATKIVLDSNIYISTFIFGGQARKAMDLALENCQIVISTPMIIEIAEVLKLKFNLPNNKISDFIEYILDNCVVIDIKGTLRNISRDRDDNKIIETAMLSGSQYLVTGDNHLLELKKYNTVKIITISQFLEVFD